jgi:hypothetical protein
MNQKGPLLTSVNGDEMNMSLTTGLTQASQSKACGSGGTNGAGQSAGNASTHTGSGTAGGAVTGEAGKQPAPVLPAAVVNPRTTNGPNWSPTASGTEHDV